MLEVVLRPRAEADLDHIAQYTIAEWGQTQAARYLADLRRQINFAAEFPDAGSPAFGFSHFGLLKLKTKLFRIARQGT